MNAVKSNVVTNMSGSQIINYALKIVKNSGISMHTLQGYDEKIYGQSFLVVEKSYNTDILDALKSGASVSSVDNVNLPMMLVQVKFHLFYLQLSRVHTPPDHPYGLL